MIMVFEFKVKTARTMLYVTIASIGFTCIVQFFALWGSGVLDAQVWWGLVSFAFSMLATLVAGEGLFYIYKVGYKHSWNKHLIFILCVLFGMIVNSLIYFGGMAVVGQLGDNFGWGLLSSYIGKTLSISLGYIVWVLGNIIKNKRANLINQTEAKKE